MTSTNLCKQCNKPNMLDANFCKSCGKPMNEPMDNNPQGVLGGSLVPPSYAGYSNPNYKPQINYHEFPKYQKSILSYSSYTITIRLLVIILMTVFAFWFIPSIEDDPELSQSLPFLQMDNVIGIIVYSIVILFGMVYVKKNYEKYTPESYSHMKYLHLFILITTVLSFFVNTPGGGIWDLFLSGYCYSKLRMDEFKSWFLSHPTKK